MTYLGKVRVEQEAVQLSGKADLALCCGLKLQRGSYQMFGCALPSPSGTDGTFLGCKAAHSGSTTSTAKHISSRRASVWSWQLS